MKYISKKHLVILIILVIVLGGALLLGERFSRVFTKMTSLVPPSKVTTGSESLVSSDNQPQSQMSSKSFIIRPGESKLSYSDALYLYRNDILQFGEDCKLVSRNKSFHLNNEIMVDNRSPKANIFYIGKSSIVIGPYDFGFMILRESGADITVECGDHKNISKINIYI